MDIFKFDGVLDSPVDERDYTYDMVLGATTNNQLPDMFLLKYQFAAKNQEDVNSCVAFSVSEMDEMIRATEYMLSPGYIYANRLDSDWQGTGMIIREALSQLIKCGIPKNDLFPVNQEYPAIKETIKTYNINSLVSDAMTRKSDAYLSLKKEEVKAYLYNEKKPVIVSINVYESFLNTVNGIVPPPSGKRLGGHAMVIVGYDNKGNFITLNHYGQWGGNNGFLLLDIDDEVLYKEFWSVTDKPIIKPAPTPTPGPTPSPDSPIIRPSGNVLYKVQVGAFKNLDYAKELMMEIMSKGLPCCIATYPTLYKVQLGAFRIKENADAMLKQAQALGYNDAFIVTVI
jgi:hypothetical protein